MCDSKKTILSVPEFDVEEVYISNREELDWTVEGTPMDWILNFQKFLRESFREGL